MLRYISKALKFSSSFYPDFLYRLPISPLTFPRVHYFPCKIPSWWNTMNVDIKNNNRMTVLSGMSVHENKENTLFLVDDRDVYVEKKIFFYFFFSPFGFPFLFDDCFSYPFPLPETLISFSLSSSLCSFWLGLCLLHTLKKILLNDTKCYRLVCSPLRQPDQHWGLWVGSWQVSAALITQGVCPTPTEGPKCSQSHAAEFLLYWLSCSGGWWAPVFWACCSSHSCHIADTPLPSCNELHQGCVQTSNAEPAPHTSQDFDSGDELDSQLSLQAPRRWGAWVGLAEESTYNLSAAKGIQHTTANPMYRKKKENIKQKKLLVTMYQNNKCKSQFL